jgi:predicted permease
MIRRDIRQAFRLALHRRDRWEREVEDEIKLHLALRAEQLMAAGADPTHAYEEAVRRFGPLKESRARLVEAARHREQRMQRTEFLSNLRQDIAFALRTLARQKAWTAVTVITLALGIGATTAVFSVVSTLLLHPLPYPNADRIVYVTQQPSEGNTTGISVTILTNSQVMRAWRQSRSFEVLEGFTQFERSLKTVSGEPSTVQTAAVFPTFPEFAGARPLVGRMFTQQDIVNGGRVALLGESFWRQRLGGSSAVLGQWVTVNDTTYMVIGVLPRSLRVGAPGEAAVDVWLPLDLRDDKLAMSVIGRLRPGVSPPGAADELNHLYARTAGFSIGKIPFKAYVTTPAEQIRFRDSLVLLAGAVALVLLVSCANVAHLLLARSATRQRELAIRAALGAGRGRLLRQLLTESLLLSFCGTVAGLFVGWAGLRALIALRPESLDAIRVARLDLTTLGIAITAAVVSGIIFGVIGATQSARHSTHDALKSGSLATSGTRSQGRARGLLVVSEMALSAMLLVGATLLVRSVVNLQSTNLGFAPAGLYVLSIPLEPSGFTTWEARAGFMRDFMGRLRAIPSVREAAIARSTPGGRSFNIGRLEIEGEPPPPKTSSSFVDVNTVQPNYFTTMRLAFKHGTTFTDTTPTSREVIVNEGFARKHWKDSPVGKRIRVARSDSTPWLTIVGVVNDAKTSGPTSESTAPMFYSPMTRVSGAPRVLVRTSGNAESLASAAEILEQMGVKRLRPASSVEQTISRTIAGPRFVMTLLAIFTALALTLAGIGLYGVMAYTVAQQTREIGIRVALGASDQRIARAVVGRGAWLAIAGAIIGLAVAAWATKLIENQLHGIERLDPMSFLIGATVLIGAALLACVVPTRRALSVDPMTAIRAD